MWTSALAADGEFRDSADVAELTGLLDLSRWPAGMRVIVRRERSHPGAQLSLFEHDGYRYQAFATNTGRGQLALPGGPAPRPPPRRGPHQSRERYRPGTATVTRVRHQPSMGTDRRSRRGPDLLD
jgi:hypothetical protein